MRMRFGLVIPFAVMRRSSVVPWRSAMPRSESPGSTMYVPLLDEGAGCAHEGAGGHVPVPPPAAGGVAVGAGAVGGVLFTGVVGAVAPDGTTRRWPTVIRLRFVMPLVSASALTDVPRRLAIAPRVSPGCTM